MSAVGACRDLNLQETELCLGLPGGAGVNGCQQEVSLKATGKRGYRETVDLKLQLQVHQSTEKDAGQLVDLNKETTNDTRVEASSKSKSVLSPTTKDLAKPPAKSQVVGWPPVRYNRKNMMAQNCNAAAFVKVCMDGAPYLRKVDLKMYKSYHELSDALANMFSSFTTGKYDGTNGMIDFMSENKLMDLLNGSEYVPTYEDKDGDWMLVGDVPWEMFVDSCKRVRIMKGSDAIGLAPRAMEKCKSRI